MYVCQPAAISGGLCMYLCVNQVHICTYIHRGVLLLRHQKRSFNRRVASMGNVAIKSSCHNLNTQKFRQNEREGIEVTGQRN